MNEINSHSQPAEETIILQNSLVKAEINPKTACVNRVAYFKDSQKKAFFVTPYEKPTWFTGFPFANRVRNGKFTFEGESYLLPRSEKHALHGDRTGTAWKVVSKKTSLEGNETGILEVMFEMSFVKAKDDTGEWVQYPFSYKVQQVYTLKESLLTQEFIIVNIDERPMPCGVGFHPYFSAGMGEGETAIIQCKLNGEYPLEENIPLPSGPAIPVPPERDFSGEGKPIYNGIDHCFSGWDGTAHILWPVSKIKSIFKASDNLKHLVIYCPPGSKPEFFAFEPSSMMTDGFNHLEDERFETGVVVLKSGEQERFWWSMEVLPM
jgi:aldose 1-epimerase